MEELATILADAKLDTAPGPVAPGPVAPDPVATGQPAPDPTKWKSKKKKKKKKKTIPPEEAELYNPFTAELPTATTGTKYFIIFPEKSRRSLIVFPLCKEFKSKDDITNSIQNPAFEFKEKKSRKIFEVESWVDSAEKADLVNDCWVGVWKAIEESGELSYGNYHMFLFYSLEDAIAKKDKISLNPYKEKSLLSFTRANDFRFSFDDVFENRYWMKDYLYALKDLASKEEYEKACDEWRKCKGGWKKEKELAKKIELRVKELKHNKDVD
eukprot:g69012.t1